MISLKERLPKSLWGRFVLLVLLFFAVWLSYRCLRLGRSLFHWKASIWALDYWTHENPDPDIPDHEKHLIFLMVDHYEHGSDKEDVRSNKEWCDKFRQISNEYRDDYGNNFKYSWFYPYDHHNEEIVKELSRMAYEGYGEIELHWHIPQDFEKNGRSFSVELSRAIDWFQQFGAFITSDETPETAFAYIAGVWDLDASRPGISHGITNQIEILHEHGCYADFTFSTIGTEAQPSKVNSLYYVEDDPDSSKSHDQGIDVRVGSVVNDRLMIFQGPISINWKGGLEYGAIESDPRFHPSRIEKWIDANIHVLGRPEWVFVKVYSHGAQSARVVLDHDMSYMLDSLIRECQERGIKLHFMTAREAYNVVKAAEAGKTGNPEHYRDYSISKYQNMMTPLEELLQKHKLKQSL